MPIDYNKYPPNWKSEIRPRILKRENDCCKFCGIKNKSEGIRHEEGLDTLDEYMTFCATHNSVDVLNKYGNDYEKHKIIKIVLTIAHLDHDAENWDVCDDRLAALCQRCHLRYDAKHKANKQRRMKYQSSLFPMGENIIQ